MDFKLLKTKNLYVGTATPIEYVDGNQSKITTDIDNGYISIFKFQRKKNIQKDIYSDVFSKKEFELFDQISFYEAQKNMSKYFLTELTPIEYYINGSKVSMSKLKNLVKKLNAEEESHDEINEEDDNSLKVTDPVLKIILDTKNKICYSNVDSNEKERFISILKLLGEFYINSLIEYKNDNKTGDYNAYKYSLKKECMVKLAKIELDFTSVYKEEENNKSLTLEHETFIKLMKK